MKNICYIICFFILRIPISHTQDIIQTEAGMISGIRTPDALIASYKGIPFAAPPVGDLRWREPQPVTPWPGVRECSAFGPSPMQAKPVPFSMWSQEFLIPETPISEDCLYLNVWSGAKFADEKRPVLVWIYGGGFVSGGSGVPIYDGEAMARKGIVFVSINYRVGIFGFFSHPELTIESGKNASGNYGLMDQLAALKWVQKNITAFGGDPHNVTIAGQSAGSMSVNCLVASPLAKGLFRRAIAHSGASFSGKQPLLAQAEAAGLETADRLNAKSLAQLRDESSEVLMSTITGMRGPIIDGYILPDQVVSIFEKGHQNQVDLVTGWNQEEGLTFGPIKNADDFTKQIREQYGLQAEKLLTFYPAHDDAEASKSQLDLARDIIFGVQNYAWANRQAESKKNKTFVYRFIRKVPGTGQYAKYGAFHTGEVPYAYGNLDFLDRPWEAADRQLENIMSSYWTNFVKSGDPNGKGLTKWPEYHLKEKQVMMLGNQAKAQPIPDSEALELVYSLIIKS